MSTDSTTTADVTGRADLLEEVLANSHPLMVEGFFLAAIPYWYDVPLFAAMRQRGDGRDAGIVGRLSQYSFTATLEDSHKTGETYVIHPVQRSMLNERFIASEPGKYLETHRRALAYWEAHPDPDPDAHARNLLYHRLFLDTADAAEYLISLFRSYAADRRLAPIDRMLATAREARHYLLLLGDALPAGYDDLLAHLETRVAQLRGHWEESLEPLERLRQKSDLPPRLFPYVVRAHGDALANIGDYVAAISDYGQAIAEFERQARDNVDSGSIHAERGHTLIAQGDAYAGLARAALGRDEHDLAEASKGTLNDFVQFLLQLPLAIYLSRHLGAAVWHPRSWGLVSDLDWIIARLFAASAANYRRADALLEVHGRPSERLVADDKLAALYLELGDVSRSEALYARLLGSESGPANEYRRATARLGLGRTLLAQGRPAAAQPHLEAALPVLRRYEDSENEAVAELMLADCWRMMDRPGEALPHFQAAKASFEKLDDRVGVTLVGERLDALASKATLTSEERAAVVDAAQAITLRHYPVRYRHPATVYFQRGMVMALALVIFFIPVLAIHLDTGIVFKPVISFHASPLLDAQADFIPDLSQTVQKLGIDLVPDPSVLWQAGLVLLLLYLVVSALAGVLVITRTSPGTVQAAAHADLVRLDEMYLSTGEGASLRKVAWRDATELVKANVYSTSLLWLDNSQAAVASAGGRVVIKGRTAWYPSLLKRTERTLQPEAEITDMSFSLVRSKMGALYLITVGALFLLSFLSVTAPSLLFTRLPALFYGLSDLYPYFYLGLFLPPMWWFVVQPLRQRRRIDPEDVRPALIAGGAGLVLAIVRIATGFRPWLTQPDIYPPLAIIVLVGSAAFILLTAPRPAGSRTTAWIRAAGVVAAILVLAVMGAQLRREVVSYHYLIRGNQLRDQALSSSQTEPDTALLEQARDAYGRALVVTGTQVLSIGNRPLVRQNGPGLPPVDNLIRAEATNSRAVMRLLLNEDPATISAEFDQLLQETQHPSVYAGRALVALRSAVGPAGETPDAVADLTQAIERDQDNARYRLWRGFALHTLGFSDAAQLDYWDALAVSGKDALDRSDRATALTGLGWLAFARAMQQPEGPERRPDAERASGLFRRAIAEDPASADAWLGLGYALYTLRSYDEALASWGESQRLRPDDPVVQLSLGALYWRTGVLVEGYVEDDGTDKRAREYCREQFTLEQRTASQERLMRTVSYWTRALDLAGLDDLAKARTISSLGQIYYLMQWCPDLDEPDMLRKSVEANDRARELDPTNPAWPFRSGRLAHNLFEVLRDRSAGPSLEAARWALRAMQDFDRSIDLTSSTDTRGFTARQNEKNSRLGAARAYVRVCLVALQRALAAGDADRATKWLDISTALAKRTGISSLELYGDIEAVGAWLAAHPGTETEPLRESRETTLRESQLLSPAVADFWDGLEALKAGRTGDAVDSYQQGVEKALETGDISSIAAAATAAHYENGNNTSPLTDLLRDALPQVEQAARSEKLARSVDAAVSAAVLASAIGDDGAAGRWLDEAVWRTAKDTSQYSRALVPARDPFKALWASGGANGGVLAERMEDSLEALFAEAPEAEQNGFFWRYSAWLKFYLGMSAFRLNDEASARVWLDSAIEDATRAYQLSTDHRNVFTYLPEAGWGAYHLARGDDAYALGNTAAALMDYEAAFGQIAPAENSGSTTDKAASAFRAGYTALQADQPERASQWYQQAISLAESAGLMVMLENEMSKLQSLIAGSTVAAPVAVGEEILRQGQAAYSRLEQQ